MSDLLPSEKLTLPPVSDAIDALCDRFEAAWELGGNWLHEALNYNTFILGLVQRGSYKGG